MSHQIEKSFSEQVELKFQLYNSLFLTLPLDAVEQTGLLLPLLNEACVDGYKKGLSPSEIVLQFFEAHKPDLSKEEQIGFLFKIIQYVERQIVLIDALEEAAYSNIHNTWNNDAWEGLKSKINDQNQEESVQKILESFGIRLVLTAHPTQFYPGNVLAIATDLAESVSQGDIAYTRELLMQLGKTPFYRKKKPTVFNEASSLIWYLSSIFYPAIGDLLERINQQFALDLTSNNKLVSLGFWPGGDRYGNPFVTIETTLKVANELHRAVINCYQANLRKIKRRISFGEIPEMLDAIETQLEKKMKDEEISGDKLTEELLNQIKAIEQIIIHEHKSLFVGKIASFRRKIQTFGFAFASLDIRQDSRVIARAFDKILKIYDSEFNSTFADLPIEEQVSKLLQINQQVNWSRFEDAVVNDTLESFQTIEKIQKQNGAWGAHRYIISNCRSAADVARVVALAKMCNWGERPLPLDVVPLFETIDDLKHAGKSMELLYANPLYSTHLQFRKSKQTVMLGFSDGTKDGGYLMANWSIFKAKEDITRISRKYQVEVLFFDGRGGPPARGGGNAHQFYAALGKNIESKQIQITVQGQTISSHYGNHDAAMHNLTHLLSAGIENNLFSRASSNLNIEQRQLIEQLAETSYQKYSELKSHPKFLPFLEERSTLKYYGMANIGSRPSKRGGASKLKFEDLRAIPFVGAWSQLKQNVPGFFGVGTALKRQEEMGNLQDCIELYQNSTFFKTLISNSMQSMNKTNFAITQYLKNDPDYGEFWELIYQEFLLSKAMVLKISGLHKLLEDNPRSRLSINLREKIVLPLLTVQQHALMQIQQSKLYGDDHLVARYEKMVMRSLFGNINASRNSV